MGLVLTTEGRQMIDEDALVGMAATYCARRGMSDDVGARFGEWLANTYEGQEWEELGSWQQEWELFCAETDVSVFDGLALV